MKRKIFAVAFAAASMLAFAFAAQAGQPEKDGIVFHDATEFLIGGKATQETLTPYDRLPASYEKTTRPDLWRHGLHSAGIYVRFRTDSPIIKARWTSLFEMEMNHMAPSGIRGLDLYVRRRQMVLYWCRQTDERPENHGVHTCEEHGPQGT